MSPTPTVLFVCAHNANRSQIAAGYATALAGENLRVVSAGPTPAERLNPVAVEAMAEEGVDISDAVPALLTEEALREADVVVTLGCPDAVPDVEGKRFEDWALTDSAGRDLHAVRPLRDEIRGRVERLVADLM